MMQWIFQLSLLRYIYSTFDSEFSKDSIDLFVVIYVKAMLYHAYRSLRIVLVCFPRDSWNKQAEQDFILLHSTCWLHAHSLKYFDMVLQGYISVLFFFLIFLIENWGNWISTYEWIEEARFRRQFDKKIDEKSKLHNCTTKFNQTGSSYWIFRYNFRFHINL